MAKGRVYIFGDDIDTDMLAPGGVLHLGIDEIKRHCLESIDRDFHSKVRKGDVLLAGSNFGAGSSREQAPVVLKELGIDLVLAETFARIFFRNAVNVGLNIGIVGKDLRELVQEGQEIEYEIEKSRISGLSGEREYKFEGPSGPLSEILKAGGMKEFVRKKAMEK